MTHDAAAEVMEVFCYGWGSAMIKQQRYEDGLLKAAHLRYCAPCVLTSLSSHRLYGRGQHLEKCILYYYDCNLNMIINLGHRAQNGKNVVQLTFLFTNFYGHGSQFVLLYENNYRPC